METTLSLEDLYLPIAKPLEQVRATMTELWLDALRLAPVEHLPKPKLGGKMLRPALCLLSAGAIGGTNLEQYSQLAAAFEALHIASLAHDDVIDRAYLRRGQTSLNALWDNHAAVLGGDYLVARSVNLMAKYGSCAVIDNAITSVRRMAEGELLFFGRRPDEIREADCIELARGKTASLFAEACSAPAHLLDPSHIAALHAFGIGFGIAFQLADDLLDVTQPTEQLGKAACGDIVEGKTTIPILYLRESLDESGRKRLDALRDADITDRDREWVFEMAEKGGVRERTEAIAGRYSAEALERLRSLPESSYRNSIEGLAVYSLLRTA